MWDISEEEKDYLNVIKVKKDKVFASSVFMFSSVSSWFYYSEENN